MDCEDRHSAYYWVSSKIHLAYNGHSMHKCLMTIQVQ